MFLLEVLVEQVKVIKTTTDRVLDTGGPDYNNVEGLHLTLVVLILKISNFGCYLS